MRSGAGVRSAEGKAKSVNNAHSREATVKSRPAALVLNQYEMRFLLVIKRDENP